MKRNEHCRYFAAAFAEARAGVRAGHGGPFGAAVVKDGRIVARGHNTVLRDNDPSAHAEINAIRTACRSLRTPHLSGCVLIATSEPCPMCLTAAYWAGLRKILYAVPRSVAARAGFDDGFIYLDLERPPAKRRVRVSQWRAGEDEGAAIFADWRRRKGKLY